MVIIKITFEFSISILICLYRLFTTDDYLIDNEHGVRKMGSCCAGNLRNPLRVQEINEYFEIISNFINLRTWRIRISHFFPLSMLGLEYADGIFCWRIRPLP